jgi:DNA-binding MarR family transcriptional regulator
MKKYADSILESIFELQIANRNISEQDLSSNIILILLSQEQELTLSELGHFLNCPQSYLTHLLKRMLTKKLISCRQDKLDLRFRYYRISTKGAAIVKTLDSHYDSILKNKSSALPNSSSEKLAKYFERLCDHANIATQIRRKGEHIIRPQQRRLAALIGLTGRQILELKLSPTEFHVLRLISKYSGLITVKDLAAELNLKTTQISAILKQLLKLKHISYRANYLDERSRLLEITTLGLAELNTVLSLLTKRIEGLLKPFSQQEQHEFSELFYRFAANDLDIKKNPSRDNQKVRALILEWSFYNRTLNSVPATIADSDNTLFMLSSSSTDSSEINLLAVVQIAATDNLIDFICWKPELALYQLRNALNLVQSETKAKLSLAPNLLQLLA